MSFFNELKRRNVFRVGIVYLVVAWLVMQVADVVINNIGAPDWVFQVIMLVLGIGFPIVLIFAWAFEMTPEGIKKEKDVDRSQSITKKTGRKLDLTIIGILALVAVYFIWESRFQKPNVIPATAGTSATVAEPDVSAETSGAPAKPDNSIAVLPFANRSNQDDDLFFTDGIHDDLLTQLAKISDLKVISRTSVMEYRDTTKKIPEIAAELGVATILEGGIQRAGNRIRINAQLIDVSTDEHIWAETFDREMTVENIFDIQSEITRQIVTAVKGELSDEETEVLTQLPTRSMEAYEAYLHAKSLVNAPDYNQNKYIEAETWVKKATVYDPEFALAWAMMVTMHGQAIWQGYDLSPERYQLVDEALKKATQLGPFLPETLAARAEYLYRIESNFHEAEIAFSAAVKARPGDSDLLSRLAYTLRRTGKFEKAVSTLQVAAELDPENLLARSQLVETLVLMGDFDRAEPLIDLWSEKYPQAMDIRGYKAFSLMLHHGDLVEARNWMDQLGSWSGIVFLINITQLPMLERNYELAIKSWDHPQFEQFQQRPWFKLMRLNSLSQAYLHWGYQDKSQELARQAIETALQMDPRNDSFKGQYLAELARAYALNREYDKAQATIAEAGELLPTSRDSLEGPGISASNAWIMALSGQRDEALLEIERLLDTPAGLSRWNMYLNPNWDFFRDDERFNDLIRPLNLKESGP